MRWSCGLKVESRVFPGRVKLNSARKTYMSNNCHSEPKRRDGDVGEEVKEKSSNRDSPLQPEEGSEPETERTRRKTEEKRQSF